MKWTWLAWMLGLAALLSACGNNCNNQYPYQNNGCVVAQPYYGTPYQTYPYGTQPYPYGTQPYYGH
jgi:hypothetical protein